MDRVSVKLWPPFNPRDASFAQDADERGSERMKEKHENCGTLV